MLRRLELELHRCPGVPSCCFSPFKWGPEFLSHWGQYLTHRKHVIDHCVFLSTSWCISRGPLEEWKDLDSWRATGVQSMLESHRIWILVGVKDPGNSSYQEEASSTYLTCLSLEEAANSELSPLLNPF